jgi:hypothetical protein
MVSTPSCSACSVTAAISAPDAATFVLRVDRELTDPVGERRQHHLAWPPTGDPLGEAGRQGDYS